MRKGANQQDNGVICQTRNPKDFSDCIVKLSKKSLDRNDIKNNAIKEFGLTRICNEYEKDDDRCL